MQVIKKYWLIILIGLILRLIIAGFTFHPDLMTPAVASAVPFKLGSLDFYGKSAELNPLETFDDLPLSYLISLPFHLVARPFIQDQVEEIFFSDRSILFGQPAFWVYLLYVKFPLIVFDMFLGVLLAAIVVNSQKKILMLWMFNPVTLWATAAVGQLDIYPTFFIVLSFLLLKKGQLNWSAFSLGVGGAIKSAPFLLVPFLLMFARNTRERILILIFAAIPYLVTVIPYLPNEIFRQNALFAPQLSKMFYANLPLSGAEAILIIPTILLFLYLLYFSKKRELGDFLGFSITTLLVILSFTHFHMQWFLWVTPLIIIWLSENWRGSIILAATLLFFGWLVMLFLFESSLQVKLFAPLFPILDMTLGLKENLSEITSIFLRNLAASIFAASSGFIILRIFKKA